MFSSVAIDMIERQEIQLVFGATLTKASAVSCERCDFCLEVELLCIRRVTGKTIYATRPTFHRRIATITAKPLGNCAPTPSGSDILLFPAWPTEPRFVEMMLPTLGAEPVKHLRMEFFLTVCKSLWSSHV